MAWHRCFLTLTLFKTQIVHFTTLIKTGDCPIINRQHSRSFLTPKKTPCVRHQMKLHTLFKIKTLKTRGAPLRKTIPYTAAHSVPILVGHIRECPLPPRPGQVSYPLWCSKWYCISNRVPQNWSSSEVYKGVYKKGIPRIVRSSACLINSETKSL